MRIYGKVSMEQFAVGDMLSMQNKDKWEAICPENGTHKLLWMIGEVGEVIDIV